MSSWLHDSPGDHSETAQLDFDPGAVSFTGVLTLYLAGHDASRCASRGRYMSAVFFHDEEQRQDALAAKAREEARIGRPVVTEIPPASVFHAAEDHHQKYYLQGDDLLAEFHTSIARVRRYRELHGRHAGERLSVRVRLVGATTHGAR